jgi:type IV pilus assembly protein PilP
MTGLLVLALLAGGRDPFVAPKEPPPDSSCAEELCRFKLDELRLVAVVSGDANPVAMVEDPFGKGIIVRRRARIGKRGGRVTAITRECITVTEQGEKLDLCIRAEPRELLAR